MRTYIVTYSSCYSRVETQKVMESLFRIRTVTLHLYKKWFGGRSPKREWHEDGFMAEAWDRHGNRITVEQINYDDPRWLGDH